MKICFLAAANSVHSQRWIEYFADAGHEVSWISLPRDGNKFVNLAFAAMQIRTSIARIKPDVLHAHYASSYGLLAALSGFHPYVLTAWGSDILITGQSKLGFFVRFAVGKADLITCDAAHMREAMVRLGVTGSKIRMVPFGTDVQKYTPERRNDGLRRRLGINSHLVISLRSLEPVYDVETLVRAVSLVLRELPSVKFLIVGKGSQEGMLRSLVAELSVSESVLFIGSLFPGDVPMWLASADVYVSTALSDAGLAASTAEAMACGIPVVVTDFGENGGWVKDGESGFLFPPGDCQRLAHRILTLLRATEGDRNRLGTVGRGVIEARDNYRTEMAKMEQIYRGLK